MNVATLAIVCAFAVPIVAIICGTLIAITKRNRPGESKPEDLKLIQELHQGLGRMEKRIEALETIIYDQHKKENRS